MNTAIAAPDTTEPDVLVFTDAAAHKVSELIREEGNANLKLRVFVSGGGCSGFQYGFTFDENEEDGDTCVEKHGVRLLVDPMSFQYLDGRRDRLPRRPRRRAVRDPQSERARPPAAAARPSPPDGAESPALPPGCRTSSRRWISAPTAFTWSSPVTTTGSSSSSTACAKWCVSPRASTSTAGSSGEVDAARAAMPRALRPAPARHARRERARGRHQHAAQGQRRKGAFLERARECARSSHRNHLRRRRSAPDLSRRRAHDAARERAAPRRRHRRRQHRTDHRRRPRGQAAREPVHGLRELQRAITSPTARSPRSA